MKNNKWVSPIFVLYCILINSLLKNFLEVPVIFPPLYLLYLNASLKCFLIWVPLKYAKRKFSQRENCFIPPYSPFLTPPVCIKASRRKLILIFCRKQNPKNVTSKKRQKIGNLEKIKKNCFKCNLVTRNEKKIIKPEHFIRRYYIHRRTQVVGSKVGVCVNSIP